MHMSDYQDDSIRPANTVNRGHISHQYEVAIYYAKLKADRYRSELMEIIRVNGCLVLYRL